MRPAIQSTLINTITVGDTVEPPRSQILDTNSSIEASIPTSLNGLLRSRSPVRDAKHAAKRLAELPPIQSINEANECLEWLEEAEALPDDNDLHINLETYRNLANSLLMQSRELPKEPTEPPLLSDNEIASWMSELNKTFDKL